jgi:hypothetical protein
VKIADIPQGNAIPGVSIRASVNPSSIKSGAKVYVNIDIINNTDKVLFTNTVRLSLLDSEVYDGNGVPVLETAMGCGMHLSKQPCTSGYTNARPNRVSYVEIRPRQQFSYTITLSDEYHLEALGAYTVSFKIDSMKLFDVPVGGDLSRLDKYLFTKVGLVASNTFKFEITP